jgi:hypothetical protein
MRFILAGLFLLLISASAFAQATGEVESIGFNGSFRPDAWTPMVVRIKPDTTESANYEIEVWQHDLDGDRPVYTRPIVLNGSGQASQQRFWMYFLPQPIDHGLPDQSTGTMRDLQRDLQVFLCTPAHKQIALLPITSQLQNVDPYRSTYSARPRGAKLILAVSSSGSKQPTLGNYDRAVGAMQDVEVVSVRPTELPDDPLGYDAVDAIIWLDGNPAELASGNIDTLQSLKDYVRFGGHLIVSQSTVNWQDDLGFGEMLPVDVQGISSKNDFEPLRSLAHPLGDPDPLLTPDQTWSSSTGPYQMARAQVRSGATVESWISWKPDGSDQTPWLARKSFGLGEVTWVAQPLSTDAAPNNVTAWPYIWDRIFGWKNDSYVLPDKASEDDADPRFKQFAAAGPADLGYTLVQGLNLSSKATYLIFLAIFFFAVYWIVAGPGTFFYLRAQKKQRLSWFLYGASALIATAVTVLVVKLVLRGPPEVRHLTFVRAAPGEPAIVYSRFGLYIPRDGDQKIELENISATSLSYLSPFAEHPQQLGDVTEFPSPADYFVPVRDLKSDTLPQLTVPYRSSLKKFQARWVGDLPGRIAASVKLDPDDYSLPLIGTLTNNTGVDLNDIYLAFNLDHEKDWMIYIPNWPKNSTFDIKRDFAKPMRVGKESVREAVPGDKKVISDVIASGSARKDPRFPCWINFWFGHFHRSSTANDDPNITESESDVIYPMLSVFDRIPAVPKTPSNNGSKTFDDDRVELYNRGARMINASASIAAGQLVVLATTKGPLPIPVQVDDNKVTGDGTVFYQFILPIDRGKLDEPTTKPEQ